MDKSSLLHSSGRRNLDALMGEKGVYYCIPEYQRHFCWKKENVMRLFEDVAEGLKRLIVESNKSEITRSSRFLGAFVCFQEQGGDHNPSLNPGQDGNPRTILSVIDGQQRLTALTLLCAEIHNQLRVQQYNTKIGQGWLKTQIKRNVKSLAKALGEPYMAGRRFYPKTIRALDDKWGDEGWQKYQSELAKFLDEYDQMLQDNDKNRLPHHYKFKATFFDNAMKCITEGLENIKNGGDIDMPSLDELFDSKAENSSGVMKELFGSEPDSDGEQGYILWKDKNNNSGEGKNITLNRIEDGSRNEIRGVLLLLFFVRYLYTKCILFKL